MSPMKQADASTQSSPTPETHGPANPQRWYGAGSTEEELFHCSFGVLDWLLPQVPRPSEGAIELNSTADLEAKPLLAASLLLIYTDKYEEDEGEEVQKGVMQRFLSRKANDADEEKQAKDITQGFPQRFLSETTYDSDEKEQVPVLQLLGKRLLGRSKYTAAVDRMMRDAMSMAVDDTTAFASALDAGVGGLLRGLTFSRFTHGPGFRQWELQDHYAILDWLKDDGFVGLLMDYFVRKLGYARQEDVFREIYDFISDAPIPRTTVARYQRIWRSVFTASPHQMSAAPEPAAVPAPPAVAVAPEIAAVYPDEESRLTFIRGCVCMAQSDGEVDPDEQAFFLQAAVGMGLSPQQVQRVSSWLSKTQPAETIAFDNKRQTVFFLKEAMQMAFLDGSYDETERAAMRTIAANGGVSLATIEAIEDWVTEGIDWREQGEALLELEG